MSHGQSRGEEGESTSRRTFLRALGGSAGLAATPLLADVGAAADEFSVAEFEVSGTETIRVEIEPDRVTSHVEKRSSDLRERYGIENATVSETETIEREEPRTDDLPREGTRTIRRPWETYYAKEAEWKRLFARGEEEASASDHEWYEESYPYGIWQYKSTGGGYEVSSPMNIISSESLESVSNTLKIEGGWHTFVADHTRYAWNSSTNRFENQHRSMADASFGVWGRNHLRMWEFEGYTTAQAHIDSPFPHVATSYLEAEREVEEVFDSASGWWGYRDSYTLPNCCPKDHNGYATRPYRF